MADVGKKIDDALAKKIVAKIVAGEAAGEGKEGMQAVLNVMLNRAKKPKRWGATLYEVATQPSQFSAYKDKALMERNYKQVKPIVDKLVDQAWSGNLQDITGGATHYVTKALYEKKKNDPKSWISKMKVIQTKKHHIFMVEP